MYHSHFTDEEKVGNCLSYTASKGQKLDFNPVLSHSGAHALIHGAMRGRWDARNNLISNPHFIDRDALTQSLSDMFKVTL